MDELGNGVERSAPRALELYRNACAQRIQLAFVLEGSLTLRDPSVKDGRGRRQLDAACTAGENLGCYALGLVAWKGRGEPKSAPRAALIWQRACAAGELVACSAFAYLLDSGTGVKRDSAEAAKLLERACSGGRGNACDHLGILFWKGRGVEMNHARAGTLFGEACKRGSARGCTTLGILRVEQGQTKEARALFELACSADDVIGCECLGFWHKDFGAAADAVQPLTSACAKGQGHACTELGLLYDLGRTTSPDKTSAAKLFERACTLDDALGCTNWSIQLRRQHDYSAAAAPARKACRLEPCMAKAPRILRPSDFGDFEPELKRALQDAFGLGWGSRRPRMCREKGHSCALPRCW
jgi:TPR repeat protein